MRRCATIIIGDVMKKKISVCENSMVLVYILAMSGGFMDAYSYMCRGEVFAIEHEKLIAMANALAVGHGHGTLAHRQIMNGIHHIGLPRTVISHKTVDP